ncbi:MAG: hypothetical protein H6642_17240 [Caldilineaceae bacterium]|nr:hypothetical protein [Caldilineaceae bacterium]
MSKPQLRRGTSARYHLAAILFYALLACLLTWPLLPHIATHVPGDGIDDPALAWNLWWMKVRLVEQLNPDIFHSDWLFYPIDINLAFYTLTPLNGLISLPLQFVASLTLANNLLVLLSYVLCGYGAYLLALDLLVVFPRTMGGEASQRESAMRGAALVAGSIYAFSSSKLFYLSLGQFNIISSYWIPFCILYILRTGRATTLRSGIRNAIMAGLFLVFQSWAELTYASFLLIFLALYGVWRLLFDAPANRTRIADMGQLLARFGVMGLVFIAGISPILWAMLSDMRREGDFFTSGGGFADTFSADLLGYLLPTRLHPLFGAWAASQSFPNDKGQQIYLGYALIILALFGLITALRSPASSGGRPARRWGIFWGGAFLFFWLMTLGPEWRWGGNSLGIPGPFALVSRLPFFNGNRYPSRYGVMLVLSAAMLAAFGAQRLLMGVRGRKNSILLIVPLIALLLFEHLSAPLPLNDFRAPPLFDELADATASTDSTLLELPTGWRNGARVMGRSDTVIMMQQWYQTVHGLRRLGGNTSRNPAYKFQYFTEAPLIGDLIALMNADESNLATQEIAQEVESRYAEIVARDRVYAPEVLDFLGVEYVLIYVDHAPPVLLRFAEDALPMTLVSEWQGADWMGRPSTLRLYRVEDELTSPSWRIDLSADEGKLHLAEGWSSVVGQDASIRYAIQPTAALLLDLPEAGGKLQLELCGPAEEAIISLNGEKLGRFTLHEKEATSVVLTIPKGVAQPTIDRLTLHFVGAGRAPGELAEAPDSAGWPIGASGAYLAADASIAVRSAGADVGNFAQIYVNGKDVLADAGQSGQRGYNLVALNATGKVMGIKNFDTFADFPGSANVSKWLAQWPVGTLIAGAIADDAGLQLDNATITAFKSIGVTEDLSRRFRWSHAFIGVVGIDAATESRQVPESVNLLAPAEVTIGSALSDVKAYGGIRSAEFNTP